jgi:hypothetical protein
MSETNERRASLQHVTDEEIASTIRYLDPNPSGQGTNDEIGTGLVICVSMIVLVLGAFAYLCLSVRIP